MKQRINLAISKILMLQAEFTEKELNTAILLIRKMEIDSFLKSEHFTSEKKTTRNFRSSEQQEKINTQGIIRNIEGLDSEKYSILSSLIDDINDKKLSLKLDEVRAHALKIDKNFKAGKTVKETLPKFIDLLRNLSTYELGNLVQEIREVNKNDSNVDNSYQNLAQFLIKGE